MLGRQDWVSRMYAWPSLAATMFPSSAQWELRAPESEISTFLPIWNENKNKNNSWGVLI